MHFFKAVCLCCEEIHLCVFCGCLKVVMVKNREVIVGEFDRLLKSYGVQHYSELPSATTEGKVIECIIRLSTSFYYRTQE